MEALIKVTEQQGKQVVSARELHEFLGLASQHWALWYRNNILNNRFAIEGEDYTELPLSGRSRNFALSLDFAKRLSMMSQTEKGEQARQYFLDCEKKVLAVQDSLQKPLTPAEFLLQQAQAMVAYERRVSEVEEDVKELKAARQTRPEYYTVVGYGTLHGISVNLKLAGKIGQKASRLCRERGITIDNIPDPRFGTVNVYPKKVLDEVFEMNLA